MILDKRYGPHITIVCVPAARPSCDLQVRVKDITQPLGYRVAASFNDMSNDFAHADAHNAALGERRKLVEGEV